MISRGLLKILAIPFLFPPYIPLPADGFESVGVVSLLGEWRAQRAQWLLESCSQHVVRFKVLGLLRDDFTVERRVWASPAGNKLGGGAR